MAVSSAVVLMMGLCESRSATAVVGKITSKASLWRTIPAGH